MKSLPWPGSMWNSKRRIAYLPRPKTDTPRHVPLSSNAIAALQSLKVRSEGTAFALRAESMSHAFERSCEPHRANVTSLHFHDLRHEAASRHFKRGLGVMEVAAIPGHKTLEMLKRLHALKSRSYCDRTAGRCHPANPLMISAASHKAS